MLALHVQQCEKTCMPCVQMKRFRPQEMATSTCPTEGVNATHLRSATKIALRPFATVVFCETNRENFLVCAVQLNWTKGEVPKQVQYCAIDTR